MFTKPNRLTAVDDFDIIKRRPLGRGEAREKVNRQGHPRAVATHECEVFRFVVDRAPDQQICWKLRRKSFKQIRDCQESICADLAYDLGEESVKCWQALRRRW